MTYLKMASTLDLTKNLLLCDTSYIVFFKYYSLVTWWKMAEKGDAITLKDNELPEEFKQKFYKTFMDMFKGWCKRYDVAPNNVVFARDCPRDEIWRNDIYPQYKATRAEKSRNFNGSIFQYMYDTVLNDLKKNHGCKEVCCPRLEADDCIAILVKYLRKDCNYIGKITIITNDNDYIQLHPYDVDLINLQHKSLYDRIPNVCTYLHLKQIMGDTSDNIPPIASKVGPKTAERYVQDHVLLQKQLSKEEVKERYDMNKKLIDFNEIPSGHVNALLLKLEALTR